MFSITGCTRDKNELNQNSNSRSNKTSQVNSVNTNSSITAKTTEEFTVTTADNKKISGSLYFTEAKKNELQPLVILIHQFNQSRSQWQNSFIDSLLAAGYKAAAFDIRGHGSSDKQNGGLESILSDPDQAPKDITAVTEWAKKQKGIDSTRIAAIGTSVGGNMALYGALNLGIKVSIAVSNGKSTFEAFTGYNELMMGRPYFPKLKNVLLICGSKDGDHEAGEKWIFENFCEDPKELKVYDSQKHGKFLIEEQSDLEQIMINWLKKYL